MDLVSAATNLQSSSTMAQIQMAVAKKILNNQRMNGAAAIKLLEAATASTTQAGDQMTAAALGLGSQIDVYG